MLRASSTARLAVCSQAPGTKVHAIGHALHRPLGRPLARLDGGDAAGILRRGAARHRADGVLLSRPGCEGRRPAAAARMRRAVASATCSRRCRSSSSCWRSGSYAQNWHLGDAAGHTLQATMLAWRTHLRRKRRPRVLPLPHPSWRNNAWLKRQSLVRGGAFAGAAPRGETAALTILPLALPERK